MNVSEIRIRCLVKNCYLFSKLREKAKYQLNHLNAELLCDRRFQLICHTEHNSYLEYHISKKWSHLTHFKMQHIFLTNECDAK